MRRMRARDRMQRADGLTASGQRDVERVAGELRASLLSASSSRRR